MNLGNKKSNLLILLAVFILGGCGNFSGNYEEIESSASSESTTTDDGTTPSTTTPTAIDSWGSKGTGSGQYMGDGSIIANSDYIYISSSSGSGISKFDTSGNTIAHNSTYNIRQINFHPSDTSKIYGYANPGGKVKVFDLSLNEISSDNSSISSGDHGLTVDTNGNVYVSGYHNDYKVSKYSDNGTLGLSLVTSWGSLGESSGQFSNPQYVHIYDSFLYVADLGFNTLNGNKVVVYDLNGNLQKTISMSTYGSYFVYDICFNDSKLYVVVWSQIVKINISDNSVYQKTIINDESGGSISSGNCAIMSNHFYFLSNDAKKIYKFNLSDL